MALQTVTLCLDDSAVPYARQRKFLYCTWHVVEIFLSELRDRHGFELDACRELHILVRPTKAQKKPKPPGKRAVREIEWTDFDVDRFFAAAQPERDALAVDALEGAVRAAAKAAGADPKPVWLAAEATRGSGFDTVLPAPRVYPWERPAPQYTTPSGHTAALVRRVALGTQAWGVRVCDAAGAEVAVEWIPRGKYQNVAPGQVFRRARGEGSVFRLEDDRGRTSFKLDVKRAVTQAGPAAAGPPKQETPRPAARKRRPKSEPNPES